MLESQEKYKDDHMATGRQACAIVGNVCWGLGVILVEAKSQLRPLSSCLTSGE